MFRSAFALFLFVLLVVGSAFAQVPEEELFDPGHLKPHDSKLHVKVGDRAPDFNLRSTQRERISLFEYHGKKNVVLSFVPAAWTPVCSDQWPGYNIAKSLFDEHDAVLLGITVDNVPSQHAWVHEMGGLWFPVLSDFWPHGAVAERYGVLRSDGVAERALVIIDKQGFIRFIHVADINTRPPLELLAQELEKLKDPLPETVR